MHERERQISQGEESERGEGYGEVEDYELGLTYWFVATSIQIAFSATVRARPGAVTRPKRSLAFSL